MKKRHSAWFTILTLATVGSAALTLSGCSVLDNITGGGEGVVEGEGESTDVFTIEVGDCLNDAEAGETVSDVPVVDCAEPHDSEAFKSIIMDDGDFPGQAAIDTASEEGCVTAFAEFAGISYEESTLGVSWYFPTEDGWSNGDREILCLVYSINEDGTAAVPTTGCLAGAGI